MRYAVRYAVRDVLAITLMTGLLHGCFGSIDELTNEPLPLKPPVVKYSGYQPLVSASWQWQLTPAGGKAEINSTYVVEVYDIDLFDSSIELIQQLHNQGSKVICYFSAGSYEDWRPDAAQFKEADLGNKLEEWEGERWLDIRSNNVHKIMQKRLDLAQTKNCDGVEPDNLDGYTNDPGFSFSANDQLAFNRFIANEAHLRGLSVGLKNDLDQVQQLVDYFDFAVNEQCFEYNECDRLQPFILQNKAVFNAEYPDEYTDKKAKIEAVCARSQTMRFSTLFLPLNLDDAFRYSCLP